MLTDKGSYWLSLGIFLLTWVWLIDRSPIKIMTVFIQSSAYNVYAYKMQRKPCHFFFFPRAPTIYFWHLGKWAAAIEFLLISRSRVDVRCFLLLQRCKTALCLVNCLIKLYLTGVIEKPRVFIVYIFNINSPVTLVSLGIWEISQNEMPIIPYFEAGLLKFLWLLSLSIYM